jgi:hypothetical protein
MLSAVLSALRGFDTRPSLRAYGNCQLRNPSRCGSELPEQFRRDDVARHQGACGANGPIMSDCARMYAYATWWSV